MRLNGKRKTRIAVALATSLVATQSVSSEIKSEKTDSVDESGIERVVVTSRKRSEALVDTPIAVSSFSDKKLTDMGAHKMGDFLQSSPGVALVDSGDFQQLSVRGVSTSLGGNANGYYLNNIPFTGVTVPWNPNVQSFDLQRVEVLRGPQGTLFGEGAMGGTVRILTNQADPVEFYGKIDGQFSSTDDGNDNDSLRGMVNLPILEDVAALRVVAIEENQGGWIDIENGKENYNEIDTSTYRVQLKITPTERLSLDFAFWKSDQNIGGSSRARDDMTVLSSDGQSEMGYEQYSFTGEYEFDTLAFSYAYGKNELYNDLSTPIPGLGLLTGSIDISVETHELLFRNNDDGKLDWTFGYYYRDGSRNDTLFIVDFLDSISPSTSTAEAVFGEVEYQFSDEWSLAVGARYFEETLEVSEFGIGLTGPIDANHIADFSKVSPRAILSYQANKDWLIYLSGAQGFRGGQAQPAISLQLAEQMGIILPASLDSDTITTYELGSKTTLLDGTLVIEGAAYHSDWKDVPVRFEVLPGAINGIYQSKGLTISGVELAVTARLTRALTMNAGISVMDPEYSADIPNSPVKEGDNPANISEVTGNVSLTYRDSAFSDFDWFGFWSTQYFSERVNTNFATYTEGDDVVLMNARFGIDNSTYGVYLFANNITNEDGALSAREPDLAVRNQPRTFGIEMSLQF